MNAIAVFHFHLAQVTQMRAPSSVLLQILRDSFRKQDMTGITTIHQSLRDVDADSSRVDATVNVHDFAHRAAMHAHADRQIGMMF